MSYYTSFYIKPQKASVIQTWRGFVFVDWDGNIISSTLASTVSAKEQQLAVASVVDILNISNVREFQFREMTVDYEMLRVRITFFASRIQIYFTAQPRTSELPPASTDPDVAVTDP